MLDHGLRVGEVVLLMVGDLDLSAGELRFYRPKVDKRQTHTLTADTRQAAERYLRVDRAGANPEESLWRASLKDASLHTPGLTEQAVTERVRLLGERIGAVGLSAHDLRHTWATRAARAGTDPFRLQEAGGWASLAMPRHYVEDAKIANAGVKLE
jgi:integrase